MALGLLAAWGEGAPMLLRCAGTIQLLAALIAAAVTSSTRNHLNNQDHLPASVLFMFSLQSDSSQHRPGQQLGFKFTLVFQSDHF